MKKKKKLGLGKNANTNMVKAIEDIKKYDMQSRMTSIGKEESEEFPCLGIVHGNDWMHGPRIDLYGWNSCLIVSDLSKRGCLVGYLDATVFGNFGLSNTIYKSKVQTLLFGIQPADVYISAGDIAIMPKKFKMKGVKIAALIATKFKAPDMLRFFNKFFDNCTECTGEKIKPLLIHTDCAGQLKTGIIMATRSDGQVTTQIQYANVNCVLFLRMSFMMEIEIKKTGDWIETAKWGRTIQLQYSNCTIHE